ncbi:MAG TPA: hypothetical protein VIY48_21455 [Candidatus Paceibacterota bacterium]
MQTLSQIIEATVVLVVLYLVLANAFGFSTVLATAGNVYSTSVKTLQGR